MKKSKIDYLKELNEPERSRALRNYDEDFSDECATNVEDALMSGFDWSKSPEGHNYWDDIYERLKDRSYVFGVDTVEKTAVDESDDKKMSDWLDKIEEKHKVLEDKLERILDKLNFGGVNVVKIVDKSEIDLIWEDIVDNFEWDKLWVAMDAVGWRWVNAQNGVPSLEELIAKAKELVYQAYEQKTVVGTGGFEASYGLDEGSVTVSLKFVFERWEGFADE